MRSVAYLVPEFPRLSESFVAREVVLANRRLPVHVISLGRVRAADEAMLRDLEAAGVKVEYILDRFPARLAWLAMRFLVRSPVRSAEIVREKGSSRRTSRKR